MPDPANLHYASILEIGRLFRARKLSPRELTQSLFDRIDKLNPCLNAFITLNREEALRDAGAAEAALCAKSRRKSAADLGPLHGIPISIKDNIYTRNLRTTAGSQVLQDFVPLHDASVVTDLRAAGAVILGKTNLHEFAYGVTSNNPHFGPVRNPWDTARIPGGSSGGSAAALAAGLGYGSIGTDTGGSIRIPAALCGVVGLKPGLARVDADGVVPLSRTLDFVGPLARTVEDAAILFEAIALRGKRDRSFRPGHARGQRSRRPALGVPRAFFLDHCEPDVLKCFEHALEILRESGARLKDVTIPYLAETSHAGNIIAWAEATQYHQEAGWFPAHSSLYSPDVRERIEWGIAVTAVDYLNAMERRKQFVAGFHLALLENEVEAMVVPTTPIVAPLIGQEEVSIGNEKAPARSLLLRNCRPANLGGFPAISVPCGFSRGGLPVGLQFMGGVVDEALLLELAHNFERMASLPLRPALDA